MIVRVMSTDATEWVGMFPAGGLAALKVFLRGQAPSKCVF
jgi:hypothetical protein